MSREPVRLAPGPNAQLSFGLRDFHATSPVSGERMAIDSDTLHIIASFSGARTVAEVVAELQLPRVSDDELDVNGFEEVVEYLVAAGLLVPVSVFEPGAVAELLFGEPTHRMQALLREHYGSSHTIPISRLPFADTSPLSDASNSAPRTALLMASYTDRELTTDEKHQLLNADLTSARALLDEIRSGAHVRDGVLDMPLEVGERPDGRLLLQRGAKPASFALALEIPVPVYHLEPRAFLRSLTQAPAVRWGTGVHSGRPYQSVFHRGECLVEGRRPDLYERIQMLRESDIRGKRVLDLGANIGMNCFLAIERGAVQATGLEAEAALMTIACRLNCFFAAPVTFIAHDLNATALPSLPACDTIFCFAILGYLHAADVIKQVMNRTGARVLYFETHKQGQDQGDIDGILEDHAFFSEIEFIGNTLDLFANTRRTRRLYRCVRAW